MRASEMQIWSAACWWSYQASLLQRRSERRLRIQLHDRCVTGEGRVLFRIRYRMLFRLWGGLRWDEALRRHMSAAQQLSDPKRRPIAGVCSWWSFPDRFCWMVEVKGDRVGLWSQSCEWLVKPSVELMFERRRLLLEALTESTPVWPRDRNLLAVVRLPLWGSSLFRVVAEWVYGIVLQKAGPGLPSPVMLPLLLWLLFTLLLLLLLLVASVCQFLIKSIFYGVMVVVVDFSDQIDLGSWFIVNRTQSYSVLRPGVSFSACVEEYGRSWDSPPNSFLLWSVPIQVIATCFGQFSPISDSIRSSLLDPLMRQSLFVRVRICVASLWLLFFDVNPSWVL